MSVTDKPSRKILIADCPMSRAMVAILAAASNIQASLEKEKTMDCLPEKIARVAHEANRAWCIANGDMSQPEWDDAPEWQKDSARNGVFFHIENPDASDSASHDSWMKQKLDEGWVYGPEKNPDATPPTHPCIVPFGELPKVQQVKDALFRAIVHAAGK